jgi:hypothetical protein
MILFISLCGRSRSVPANIISGLIAGYYPETWAVFFFMAAYRLILA